MRHVLIILCFILAMATAHAGKISGTITDASGNTLGFASVSVKGSSKGAIANSGGRYALNLEPGDYVLVCQFIGFATEERTVTVSNTDLVVNFRLSLQELKMDEVIIKRGEDPALEIIRETIKKRDFYNNQVDSFTVDVYIKGLLRSRSMPNQIFGQKIDRGDLARDGIDSAGRGILFLSESVTKVSFKRPDKIKYEVVSSRESGGGYGLSLPFFINFYVNNVSISNTNPRGFISPISDNAFHYYQFHYEGNFFEGNKMIDKIKVTPKRKNEPLFSGYLQIVDGEWRIHSLELTTTKDYSLELIDTLRITQIHAPVKNDIWKTQHQVVYVAAKKFGFDMAGNFLNVYTNYNLDPGFGKKYFNRIVIKYDSAALKKDSSYWTKIRPVPLELDEKRDYVFKDSVSKAFRDSFSKRNIDSLRRIRRPVRFKSFFLGGVSRPVYTSNSFNTYSFKPLLRELEYNTVEGLSASIVQSYNIRPRKGKNDYTFTLDTRYGFSNQHLNSFLSFQVKPRSEYWRNRYLLFSGGKRVSQFNHDNPVDPLTNSLSTLLYKKNYMKIYENWFGSAEYNNRFENGLKWNVEVSYEDRIPLQNTTDYSLFKKSRVITPNHPYELAGLSFERHQAFVGSLTLSYQPGQLYIQYPYRKVPIGSKYPTFELQYSKGIKNIFGSDVDFDKWKFSITDNLNLRLGGQFRYRVSVGGFLNNKTVEIPDLQHFNGNQTFYNFKYLNSFQLAPYYRYSNAEKFYALAHVEHHFNGLLTNKIPLFNKLKWYLVAGSNTFYVNRNNYYAEVFAGVENVLKLFRVDFVTAYQAQPGNHFGVRVGFGGIISNMVQVNR